MSFLGDLLGTNSKFQASSGNIFQPSNEDMQGTLNNQNSFVQALQGQAAGTSGPSAAQAMLNNANQQQTSTAHALAASQQGNVNAGLASRNAQMVASQGQQANAAQGAQMRAQEQLSAQNMLGGQLNSMFQQGVGAQNANQQNSLQAQGINAGVAQQNAKNNAGLIGGLIGGGASAMMASGGEIQALNQGGKPVVPAAPGSSRSGPQSFAGQFLQRSMANPTENTAGFGLGSMIGQGLKSLAGTPNPAPEPGAEEVFNSANPNDQKFALPFAHGGMTKNMKTGGKVVGGQAAVPGDSLKNDTVPAILSPKEIVLPRSVTMSEDAPRKAAEFVAAIMAKNRMGK